MNKAILIGNIANDPEIRTTQSGTKQCSFRIAVQRRFANAQGVKEADFINIVAWRQLAELCSRYLSKGRKVAVEGTIQTRSYDAQDGTKRYVTEIVAESVEFLGGGNQQGAQEAPAAPAQGDVVKQAQETFGSNFTEVDDEELPF